MNRYREEGEPVVKRETHSSCCEHDPSAKEYRSLLRGLLKAVIVLSRLVRGGIATAALCALTVGVPWALWHYIGWPLPDHVPTWEEIQALLLIPITAELVLDIIACACWFWWVMFTLDVLRHTVELARCGIDKARFGDPTPTDPTNALARALVGAIMLAVLGNRLAFASDTASHSTYGPATRTVATAPAQLHPAGEASRQQIIDLPSQADVLPHTTTVTVRAPHKGIHDSLWNIAERVLGDGTRWPEIFELNQGKPQPHGLTFTQPSLIFPGEQLAVPNDASNAATKQSSDPGPPSTSPTTASPPPEDERLSPAPEPPPPASSAPTHTSGDSTATNEPEQPGFRWGTELFVSLGLAAAVNATLILARRRYRGRYRPGSGDRDDLPIAPVVYQLRLAHLRTDDGDHVEPDRPRPPTPLVVLSGRAHPDGTSRDNSLVVPVGVRQGQEIAVTLAATCGLGLLGAGAPAAIRALLVTTMTAATPHPQVTVIVPAGDLTALFGQRVQPAWLPAEVRVTPDLDAALDAMETETAVRHGSRQDAGRPWRPIVLAARSPGRQARRLEAIVDTGARVGVAALLLGQWRHGVTGYVREDGIISATSPGLGEPLRGAQVFHLGEDYTADLLDLLRHAQSDTAPAPVAHTDNVLKPTCEPRPRPRPNVPLILASTPVGSVHGGAPADQADSRLEILGANSEPTTSLQGGVASHRARESQDRAPMRESSDVASRGRLQLSTPTVADSYRHAVLPLRIAVLGPPRVWWAGPTEQPRDEGTKHAEAEREITSAFQPRLRELLVFLALHPDGASREALIAALWSVSPAERTTNAMNTSMSRLRRAVATATASAVTDLIVVGEGRYRLNPDVVSVDYHHFAAAVAARRRAATDNDRVAAYRQIIDTYTGPLADGLSTEWVETVREAIRRDAIDAVAALARALVHDDPQRTLDLLETARGFDPHNELIYRDIMRLQERLGQLDAIPRTLTLLAARLTELDDRPTPQTIELADRLHSRRDGPVEAGSSAREQRGARQVR
ncbi:BTAD domain-containing putative transcriptional regulator [Lentzea sp. HUAS12]|uniref:BTAD domain-containing putative transcriptional regulator n=1 Tax=Lentzea sp. HUAS12 TaxID=2951806 RepID=UPI0020A1648F|nr:BTAD domain-containing putative transcriptional regulator [Lentzea sp. HUAS12]USX56425.1 LysM peptidoglycan-binding domain-containing protein [Lentzea sp. HUAS12]